MAEAGLKEVKTYVSRRHNTFTQFILTRTIMDLCLSQEQSPGSRFTKRWWEQDGLDVEDMRTSAWEAKRIEGEEETEGTDTETEKVGGRIM